MIFPCRYPYGHEELAICEDIEQVILEQDILISDIAS